MSPRGVSCKSHTFGMQTPPQKCQFCILFQELATSPHSCAERRFASDSIFPPRSPLRQTSSADLRRGALAGCSLPPRQRWQTRPERPGMLPGQQEEGQRAALSLSLSPALPPEVEAARRPTDRRSYVGWSVSGSGSARVFC